MISLFTPSGRNKILLEKCKPLATGVEICSTLFLFSKGQKLWLRIEIGIAKDSFGILRYCHKSLG